MINQARHTFPILIIALAFALNLHGLATDSFWGDEILTASFASQPPAEVMRWTADDIHPPLYYLLAGQFTKLTVSLGANQNPGPASDWLWRFTSVVAVALTVAVTYKTAYCVLRTPMNNPRTTHHTPRAIASAAALLLALAPTAIKYGQEARMHALFMLFSALSTWLLFRAIHRPQRWTRWLAYALALAATIYTMYFGFLILAAHGGYVLARIAHSTITIHNSQATNGRPQAHNLELTRPTALLAGFSLGTVAAFLLYIPWWPVLFNILRNRAAVGAIEGGVGSPLNFIGGVVEALGPLPLTAAWAFLVLYLTGLILLARRHWPLAVFGLLWLGLPVLLPIVLGDPRALQFRYAFVLPIYLIIIAYAIFSLTNYQLLIASSSSKQTGSPNPPISNIPIYFIWLLATLSFIATLNIYHQTKPNWRGAAAYLTEHTQPADLIVFGPLWDEGRFVEYYYRGQAQLLTPAALVTNIQGRAESLRAYGGRIWAINRFAPAESPALKNLIFTGVVVSEPQVPVYEPSLLTEAALGLAAQAVESAYSWAAEAEAQGVLDPDPRTAQAVALRALGDTLVVAGRPQEAIETYQRAVDIFPGWVNGFVVLAETHESLGNLPAAAQAYQQAVAFNLQWQGPLAERANHLIAAAEWEAALETYHQIIDE